MPERIRILTVKPPWSHALIHFGKDVENRPRNVAGNYRGAVAIHAGLSADIAAYTDQRIIDAVAAAGELINPHHGHIIGIANLWAVHPDRDNGNCCPHRPSGGPGGSPWAERGTWHLCFNDPRPLAEPIPYTGALGLRWLDDELSAHILQEIGRG